MRERDSMKFKVKQERFFKFSSLRASKKAVTPAGWLAVTWIKGEIQKYENLNEAPKGAPER